MWLSSPKGAYPSYLNTHNMKIVFNEYLLNPLSKIIGNLSSNYYDFNRTLLLLLL